MPLFNVCVCVWACVCVCVHSVLAGLHEETGSMLELTRPVGSTSSQISCTGDQPLLQLCQIRALRQHTHTHTQTHGHMDMHTNSCQAHTHRHTHTLVTAHCPGNIRAHLCPEVRTAVCACGQSQGLCADCWNILAEQCDTFVHVCAFKWGLFCI